MRPSLVLAATAFFLLPLVAHALADPCASGGAPALGVLEFTGGAPDSTVYVDDRNVAFGNGAFVYLEGNGIWTPKLAGAYAGEATRADLQRGHDDWCNGIYGGQWPFCQWDPCVDDPEAAPDTLLFSPPSAQR